MKGKGLILITAAFFLAGAAGVAVTSNGDIVYVADTNNHRIQYFGCVNIVINPVSIGKVKALFE